MKPPIDLNPTQNLTNTSNKYNIIAKHTKNKQLKPKLNETTNSLQYNNYGSQQSKSRNSMWKATETAPNLRENIDQEAVQQPWKPSLWRELQP